MRLPPNSDKRQLIQRIQESNIPEGLSTSDRNSSWSHSIDLAFLALTITNDSMSRSAMVQVTPERFNPGPYDKI
jgi:hypothetical protein